MGYSGQGILFTDLEASAWTRALPATLYPGGEGSSWACPVLGLMVVMLMVVMVVIVVIVLMMVVVIVMVVAMASGSGRHLVAKSSCQRGRGVLATRFPPFSATDILISVTMD